MAKAEEVTTLTHNQAVKIKASKAVTASIYLAKIGKNKSYIKKYIEKAFGYNLENSLEKLHQEVTSKNLPTPAPAAITIFLWSDNYENAIRKAVSIGGPSNTIAGITGAIAQAYYKHIPRSIIRRALNRLTPEMERLINAFEEKHLKILMEKRRYLLIYIKCEKCFRKSIEVYIHHKG